MGTESGKVTSWSEAKGQLIRILVYARKAADSKCRYALLILNLKKKVH